MIGLENYYSEAEMQDLINELERSLQDREKLLQEVQDMKKNLSESLSEKQELVSTLRQQERKIADQAGKIEELNKNYVKLEEYSELKKQFEQLQKEKAQLQKDAQARAFNLQAQEKILKLSEEQAELREQEVRWLKENIEKEVNSRAEAKIREQKAQQEKGYQLTMKLLEERFQAKEACLHLAFIVSILYGVLVTVLMAIGSERVISDFKAFFVGLGTFVAWIWDKGIEAAIWASQVGNMVPQEILGTVLHYLLLVVVFLLIVGGSFSLLVFGAYKLVKYYWENYADMISLAVCLVSLAVIVFLGEAIGEIMPINLLGLGIIAHLLYMGIRAYIWGYKKNRGTLTRKPRKRKNI